MAFSKENNLCKVLGTTLQHPKKLCCIEISINVKEKRDSSAKSVYHWKILKCRQLIFSDPQIIASPILGRESQIYVVIDRVHYENRCFTELLEKLKLSAKEPIPVSNSIYESCLHYTLIARIAPHWNQVGKYLVNGRDFLVCNQPLPAVKLDICINGADLFITLRPLRVRMWPISLEDLNITAKITQEFKTNSISTITGINIESQWVYVLPSLKKGQIVNISRYIPASCPYKTYKELRRHWKNMYGYRLPEEEGNILYYTISFCVINPTLYTYPSVCVRTHDISIFDYVKENDILRCFHDDLVKKFPAVCGYSTFADRNLVPVAANLNKSYLLSSSSYLNFSNMKDSNVNESDHSAVVSPVFPNTISSQDDIFAGHSLQTLCSRNISLMTPDSTLSAQMMKEDLENSDITNVFSCKDNVPHLYSSQNLPLPKSTQVWDETVNNAGLNSGQQSVKQYFSANHIFRNLKDSKLFSHYKTERISDNNNVDSKNILHASIHSKQDTLVDQKFCLDISVVRKTMPDPGSKKTKTTGHIEHVELKNKEFNIKRDGIHEQYGDSGPSLKKQCSCQVNLEVDVED